MPTYSYVCDGCGKTFEKEQRISEDPIKECAFCGKPQARRQISSGNFILKGGGWYSDGYGSGSKSKSRSESSAKADKSDSSSASSTPKSDTTPKDTGTKGGESKAQAAE